MHMTRTCRCQSSASRFACGEPLAEGKAFCQRCLDLECEPTDAHNKRSVGQRYVDTEHVDYFVREDFTYDLTGTKIACWGVSRRSGQHSSTIAFYDSSQQAHLVARELNDSRDYEVQR